MLWHFLENPNSNVISGENEEAVVGGTVSARMCLRPATLLKKKPWHRCFPVSFAKFLKTSFLSEHLRWLLLKMLFVKSTRTMFPSRILSIKFQDTLKVSPVNKSHRFNVDTTSYNILRRRINVKTTSCVYDSTRTMFSLRILSIKFHDIHKVLLCNTGRRLLLLQYKTLF